MSIKEYRLTSMEEPTDAMLHELMYQVACSARQSSYNAKQVLKQKMQETIELIQRQRQTLSSNIKSAADVSFTQSGAFKKAMDYMDSFVADDFTTPVPVNEDTKVVIAHDKYGYGKEPKNHTLVQYVTITA